MMELVETGVARMEAVEVKKFLGKETALSLVWLRVPGEKISELTGLADR